MERKSPLPKAIKQGLAGLCLVASVGCTTNEPLSPGGRPLSVVAVSETVRPASPEGLSGVTHLADNRFLSIEDRGGRLWTLDVTFSPSNEVIGCAVTSPVVLEGVVDGEGCAWDPLRQTIWVGDETGPAVSEHDPKTGRRLDTLALTEEFHRIRPNRGPEGLTISPDGLTLWTCPEEAVEGDGPLASATNGTLVRLHRYVRSSGKKAWRPAEEIPYRVDPIGGRDFAGKSLSGVSGLCALADGTLLVLEREMSIRKGDLLLPSFRCRIYEVDFAGATDTSGLLSLTDPSVHPVKKTRRFGARTGFAMYEGSCLGPELADGSRSVLLVADGDDGAANRILALKLR